MSVKSVLRTPALLFMLVLTLVLGACAPATPAPAGATPVAQPTSVAVSTSAPEVAPTQAPAPTLAPTAAPTTTTVAPTEAPPPTGAPESDAPTGDAALDFLIEVSKAQLDQPAWRATITSDDGDEESMTLIEYVKPGDFRIVAADDTEIIILAGEGTFMKQGDVWQKSPIDMSGMMAEFLNQQNIEESMKQANVTDLRYEGMEKLDGRTMWVYTYRASADVGDVKVDTSTKLWIEAKARLPYRFETDSQAGDVQSTNVIEYEYDPDIKIEAPEVAA